MAKGIIKPSGLGANRVAADMEGNGEFDFWETWDDFCNAFSNSSKCPLVVKEIYLELLATYFKVQLIISGVQCQKSGVIRLKMGCRR